MIRAPLPLARDRRGVSAVEFGFIAPTFCMVLLGIFDFGHTLYMRGALQGVVQKSARDSTLESNTTAGQQAILDARVRAQVKALANNSTVEFKRRYYRTFSDAAAASAEDWTDTNNNGRCDAGEPYEDANNNSNWDADGGNDGQGGAKDATVLTVTVTYPRMFPLLKLLGDNTANAKIVATTVLKNQPYSDQGSYAAPTRRNCPA
ncbi:tight adherence protein TadE [Sphingomonas spermidinifaciens]|uniref:Tight adherence protein TadE n=1 Tax=Sphingomonas spermidinifaciens TaxID=1141889 RepID=A0A2A4B1P0_9SPHN|nr:TadE/TadG family type IV pilus assembly protein [Sphingomonas spermidinifaciens]PCD01604.1 tight adherence protein TadE [Sphingomonas spermidinifaciens]